MKLEVNNVKRILPTYNVIGVVRGSEEPDRYVIYGNHRDSWTFGSCDPSSATAAMMEMVRSYGVLVARGVCVCVCVFIDLFVIYRKRVMLVLSRLQIYYHPVCF